MRGTMILVSGMPGTGKSTFAAWLGRRLSLPVVNYDRILKMLRAAAPGGSCGELGYQFFLFELEEHMGTAFIADYIFSTKQEPWLEEARKKRPCPVVNLRFTCSPQTAYQRYTARNAQEPGPRTRPEVPFAAFLAATGQNRDFLYGDQVIEVDTEDFSKVDYERIYQELMGFIRPLVKC